MSCLWKFETYSFCCDEFLHQHVFFTDIIVVRYLNFQYFTADTEYDFRNIHIKIGF